MLFKCKTQQGVISSYTTLTQWTYKISTVLFTKMKVLENYIFLFPLPKILVYFFLYFIAIFAKLFCKSKVWIWVSWLFFLWFDHVKIKSVFTLLIHTVNPIKGVTGHNYCKQVIIINHLCLLLLITVTIQYVFILLKTPKQQVLQWTATLLLPLDKVFD